jgi:hypothetical protein
MMPFLRLPGGAIGALCIVSRYVVGDGIRGKNLSAYGEQGSKFHHGVELP